MSCKSSVSTLSNSNHKPMNVFYIWYAELCRRSSTSPLNIVKPAKPKNDAVLDFAADRIKPEEWAPILNALRLDTSLHVIAVRSRVVGYTFLYDMNTEDRVRSMKRRCASLWTDYIMRSLMSSLSCCIRKTQVLSILELDGLPVAGEYLELLLNSLRSNRTIKMLSFKRCHIRDEGCKQLCEHLRCLPNIEVVDLSSCNLTPLSGQHIANIIGRQRVKRSLESWHTSLRYEEPVVGSMAGLKRITLNNNKEIGDEGLSYILDELDDDLWMKAVDMQNCNITENISRRIIDVVGNHNSLAIADFRNNESVSQATQMKIFQILEKKQRIGNASEYDWCLTATTLFDVATYKSSSCNLSGMTAILKRSKSAPLRQIEARSRSGAELRKTNTVAAIPNKVRSYLEPQAVNPTQLDQAKKKISVLAVQLSREKFKTQKLQTENNKLQDQLNHFRKIENLRMAEQREMEKEKKLFTYTNNCFNKEPPNTKGTKEKPTQIKSTKTKSKVNTEKEEPTFFIFPAHTPTELERLNSQNAFNSFVWTKSKNKDNANNSIPHCYDSHVEGSPRIPIQQLLFQQLNFGGSLIPRNVNSASDKKSSTTTYAKTRNKSASKIFG